MELVLFVIWVSLALAAGFFAERLNRTAFGWGLISLFLSPLVAFAFLLGLGALPDEEDEDDDRVPCAFCAEAIKAEAKVCRYCQREQPQDRLPRRTRSLP